MERYIRTQSTPPGMLPPPRSQITVRVVDALEVGGAVRPGTLVDTLVIGAALGPRVHVVTNLEEIIVKLQVQVQVDTHLGAVDVAGPAANRAHWVLEGDIE